MSLPNHGQLVASVKQMRLEIDELRKKLREHEGWLGKIETWKTGITKFLQNMFG